MSCFWQWFCNKKIYIVNFFFLLKYKEKNFLDENVKKSKLNDYKSQSSRSF